MVVARFTFSKMEFSHNHLQRDRTMENSEETINFSGPNCGSSTFKTTTKPQSIEDLDGLVCNDCGHAINGEDIKQMAIQIAKDEIKKSLRGLLR